VCVCVCACARACVYIYVYMIMWPLISDLHKFIIVPDLPKPNYCISQEGSGDERIFSLLFHIFRLQACKYRVSSLWDLYNGVRISSYCIAWNVTIITGKGIDRVAKGRRCGNELRRVLLPEPEHCMKVLRFYTCRPNVLRVLGMGGNWRRRRTNSWGAHLAITATCIHRVLLRSYYQRGWYKWNM
jgi:hypothetical protein